MAIKDQVLTILERSRKAELNFIANLTEEQKADPGTYENWAAKDNIAHANYWEDVRGARIVAFLVGEELQPLPQGEQANSECYERFAFSSWEEVQALAEEAHKQIVEADRWMDKEVLSGPSTEREDRKLRDEIVGIA